MDFQDCGLRLVTKALLKRHEVTKHGKIELGKIWYDHFVFHASKKSVNNDLIVTRYFFKGGEGE